MENGAGKRIQLFREKLGLNQGEFSREIQISQTTVSRVESGEKKPSRAFLNAMMIRYAVNPDWVLTGEGAMLFSAEDYLIKGIELFGEKEMSAGLAKVFANPQFTKFYLLIKARSLVESEIDDELAAYLLYIINNWQAGERKQHWVMGQLEMAFREVKHRNEGS
ncbi:MAG: helix-turn-helix transcriptional regulator [Firmicutes bacterium]|nr:helix-turn-helix transcriptional regulator [Bacillota bacterium]